MSDIFISLGLQMQTSARLKEYILDKEVLVCHYSRSNYLGIIKGNEASFSQIQNGPWFQIKLEWLE